MKKILILIGIMLMASPVFARSINYDIVMEKLPGNEYYTTEANLKSTGTIINIEIATHTATLIISTTSLNGWDNGPILIQNQSEDNYYCGYSVDVSTYIVSGASGTLRGTLIYASGNITRTMTKEIKYYCRSAGSTPTYIHLEKLGIKP